MTETDDRARIVGINHVALAVGDADEAEAFYTDLFDCEIRGRSAGAVFLDMGDQFLALSESNDAGETTDRHRHFGLVVDDPAAVERRLDDLGVKRLPGRGFDFRDPWGNRIQVVAYRDVQFTKADHVLDGMDRSDLEKSDSAIAELAEKGMAPASDEE
ncbi:extradiol dioxygenase [Halobacteriales archaeon QH_8_68_33]|nr:MAG: extradiol dioxygenase [Halobacteriales archaeon QH_8_68_33]